MSGAVKTGSRETALSEGRAHVQPSCNLRIPAVNRQSQSKETNVCSSPTYKPLHGSSIFTPSNSQMDRNCTSGSSLKVANPARVHATSRNSSGKDCSPTSPFTVTGTHKMSTKAFPESHTQRKFRMTACRVKDHCAKPGRVAPEGMIRQEIIKKRCGWITSQSDAAYVAYHDEEWGEPIHDDRRLFELMALAGLQTDIPWSTILTKRHLYRALFADFDPAVVATFDDKKIEWLSEEAPLNKKKVEVIVTNAKHVLEIVTEFESLDAYLWSFVNHKPIVNSYRHEKQIPRKTPKSDALRKDLMRRGCREGVGATVMYSVMQAAGLTNDHVVGCFRHEECKEKGGPQLRC